MRRTMTILMALLALVLVNMACAEAEITGKAQLNQKGMKVGVSTGSATVLIVEKELPNATIVYYEDNASGFEAVAQGKLDAYIYDLAQLKLALNSGLRGVHVLDECMDEMVKMAVGISPKCGIPDFENRLNAFLDEIISDGTMDDMYHRWVELRQEEMPDIALPKAPKLHLTVGTTGVVPPFSYYVGQNLSGYDIEMARRFAAWLDADLEFKVYDYGAIVPAAMTGDVDCIMANLNVTPERSESIAFSQVTYESPLGILVRGEEPAAPAQAGVYASLDQLDGKRIGVQAGTTAGEIALERLPHVEIVEYPTFPDMAVALKSNKIDGFLGEGLVLLQMAHEDPSLVILDEKLRPYECGFVLPKNEKGRALAEEINAWLRDMRASGELDRLLKKWTESPESERTVPDYMSLPAPKGILTMTTEGTYPPMNYYRGEQCVGMEIELCALFCEANGYGLNVTTMEFGSGMLMAVQTGKVDFAVSGIAITEERQQSVLFSDPYFTGGMTMAVLNKADAAPEAASASIDALADKRIGVQTGTTYDQALANRFPDAQVAFYNTKADLVGALTSHKIDAFVMDESVSRQLMQEYPEITSIPGYIEENSIGFVFPKNEAGQALKDEFDAFLAELKAQGKLDEIMEKWFDGDEALKTMPDIADLPAEKGVLQLATESGYAPFEYVRDNTVVGFDMELAARFCEACGYGLEIMDMSFDAVLPAVQSGKCQLAAAGIAITPERAENVLFSEPYFTNGSVAVILKPTEQPGPDFWSGILESFNKTFVRENRWQLFVSGVLTTLLITLLSILLGTILGFAIYMLCRNGNPVADLITRFCLWLVQGMPMVVLLMILYYVIFGHVSISGVAVAILGFTLTFGGAVFGLLKMGVGAVDPGQYEAAYALGYSNRRTFFRIILPQALPHVLPSYRGEIVGLIKATAVVGYIAVQDLTKMGDIVRSRTYEAFFPLIAVTVIYFMLEGVINRVIRLVTAHFDPKRRQPREILKGVKTDDPN